MFHLPIQNSDWDSYEPIPEPKHPELDRLLAAASVSRRFRKKLLRDPQRVIEEGYRGETFSLSDNEQTALFSIKAKDLKEFAQGIINWFSENEKPWLRG